MIWALLVAAWLAGPFGPDLPPLAIDYLMPTGPLGWQDTTPGQATAIRFRGGFDYGGTDALTAALDAAPHARLVVFDSPGGRPLVADGVAQVIRARHLDTQVDGLCASACTIAYLAGTVRLAGRGARFGFHLGTGPLLASMAASVVLQIERKWFLRGGASLSFAERALHAPNPDPYFAPLEELMAAGYVHRALGAARAGPPVGAMLASVVVIERQTGERLAWGEAARERTGMAQAPSEAIAEQRATLVVDRWLSRSSDVAVLRLIDARLAALEWLAGQDDASCMRWQIGRDDQHLSLMQLPDALRATLVDAGAAVLSDANAYPLKLPTDDDALAASDSTVRREIGAALGKRALANASSREHGFDDPALSCAATIRYLRGLRDRPDAAGLLRWALAAG